MDCRGFLFGVRPLIEQCPHGVSAHSMRSMASCWAWSIGISILTFATRMDAQRTQRKDALGTRRLVYYEYCICPTLSHFTMLLVPHFVWLEVVRLIVRRLSVAFASYWRVYKQRTNIFRKKRSLLRPFYRWYECSVLSFDTFICLYIFWRIFSWKAFCVTFVKVTKNVGGQLFKKGWRATFKKGWWGIS